MVGVVLVAAVLTAARDPARARCSIGGAVCSRRGAVDDRGRCERSARWTDRRRPAAGDRRTASGRPSRALRATARNRRDRRIVVRTGDRTFETDDPAECHEPSRTAPLWAWTRPCRRRRDERVAEIARKLDLHPLIAEDIPERNQRAKVEEVEGDVHIVAVLRSASRAQVSGLEVDLVLGTRSLLTVHERRFDPRTLQQLRMGPGALLKRGPRLPAVRDHSTASSTATSRSSTPWTTTSTRSRTPSSRTPTSWTLAAAVHAQARAHDASAGRCHPPREIFNQLTNRDRPHHARAPRLLPRRLRPPDPGDRRGRQRPRARRPARSRSTCPRSTTTCPRS